MAIEVPEIAVAVAAVKLFVVSDTAAFAAILPVKLKLPESDTVIALPPKEFKVTAEPVSIT